MNCVIIAYLEKKFWLPGTQNTITGGWGVEDANRGSSVRGQWGMKAGIHSFHECVFSWRETFFDSGALSKYICFPLFCKVGFDSNVRVRLHTTNYPHCLSPVKRSELLLHLGCP